MKLQVLARQVPRLLIGLIVNSGFLLNLTACGRGGGSATTPPQSTITAVTVSCTPASIQTDLTTQCSATVSGIGSYSSGVTWAATDGTITSAGVFTPTTAGTATITATSTQDATKSGAVTVTVSSPPTPTTPIIVPSILVSGQQAQVTVTSFVPGAGASTQIQLFNLSGGTPSLIGSMRDDGQGGDQLAGDHVYTIVTALTGPGASSLPLRIAASAGTAGSASVDFRVQVVQIPSYATNADMNQAEDQLYNTAIQTRALFSNPNWATQSVLQTVSGNLVSLFSQFAAVANQNPGMQSAEAITRKHIRARQADTITETAGDFLTSGLLSPAQNGVSCDQLVESLGGFSGSYPNALSPDDPRLQQFAQELATLCSTAPNCQGAFTQDDFLSSDVAAAEWAHEYIVSGQALPTPVSGCSGGVMQSLASVAVKTELQQFTDLAGDAIAGLANLGQLSAQAVGQAADYLVGWYVDSSGTQHATIAQVAPNETFAAPTGTYNLACSFGGDTANATITNTPVYPQSTTVINPSPGMSMTVAPPLVTGFAPTTGPVGTPVSILGTGFDTHFAGNQVTFNGTASLVTSSTAASIQTTVPAGAISGPVTVTTSSGTTTSSLLFVVGNFSSNPVPTITALAPNSLATGSAPQTLTITGTGFLTSSTVTFNGIAHAAVFFNANQLTISLTSSDLAIAGAFPVIVTSPAPGGGASNTAEFTVTAAINPTPSISSLSPSSLPAGSASQALNINGAGFLAASTVTYNKIAHTPGFVNANQLTISLTSDDLATVGTYPVVVTNPAPGGGASAPANFSVTNGQAAHAWTWMSGADTYGQPGIYGTQGVATATNVPGGRKQGITWTDVSGNLWLFGGDGYDSTGAGGNLNDLWEYSPATKMWTWISGSQTVNATGVYGTQGIPSATNVPGARYDAVGWTDANGSLWLFGGWASDTFADMWKFDPAGHMWTWVAGSQNATVAGVYGTQGVPSTSNTPGSRYGAVGWTDAKGDLWLFGGGGFLDQLYPAEMNDLWEYIPDTGTWTWVSGSQTGSSGVYGTQGVSSADNIPPHRISATAWTDANGNLWLFGGADPSGNDGYGGYYNDLWEFSPATGLWTWVSGSSSEDSSGVYGIQGVPAPSNIPGARTDAVGWVDGQNNLWLFGGADTWDKWNDLWQYSVTEKMWTWISGSNVQNSVGSYGTEGVPSATNVPSAKDGAMGFSDAAGRLWLFGGNTTVTQGTEGSGVDFNDLWQYQP
jgi:hypothetical protein